MKGLTTWNYVKNTLSMYKLLTMYQQLFISSYPFEIDYKKKEKPKGMKV